MKIKTMVGPALAAVLLTGCINIQYDGHEGHGKKCERREHHEKGGEKREAREKEARRATLRAEAKISKTAAEQTALAKVPDGTVQSGELEMEHGNLQWSFDIATPQSKETTEVNVDAIKGNVISVRKESAADEAQEGDRGANKAEKGEHGQDND